MPKKGLPYLAPRHLLGAYSSFFVPLLSTPRWMPLGRLTALLTPRRTRLRSSFTRPPGGRVGRARACLNGGRRSRCSNRPSRAPSRCTRSLPTPDELVAGPDRLPRPFEGGVMREPVRWTFLWIELPDAVVPGFGLPVQHTLPSQGDQPLALLAGWPCPRPGMALSDDVLQGIAPPCLCRGRTARFITFRLRRRASSAGRHRPHEVDELMVGADGAPRPLDRGFCPGRDPAGRCCGAVVGPDAIVAAVRLPIGTRSPRGG